MNLQNLLQNIEIISLSGEINTQVGNLVQDSRTVQSGDVFIAIKGTASDGHLFIEKAIENGAKVVVCEEFPKEITSKITYVKVKDTTSALAKMAGNFYENPSEKLKLIGVTGTNGKTTTTTLLYQLFRKAGHKAGLISTIAIYVDDKRFETKNTTPDILTLNKYLKMMVDEGVTYCFME